MGKRLVRTSPGRLCFRTVGFPRILEKPTGRRRSPRLGIKQLFRQLQFAGAPSIFGDGLIRVAKSGEQPIRFRPSIEQLDFRYGIAQ